MRDPTSSGQFTILALALGLAHRPHFFDLAAESNVLERKMRKLGLQVFVA